MERPTVKAILDGTCTPDDYCEFYGLDKNAFKEALREVEMVLLYGNRVGPDPPGLLNSGK
jgi:hypothetical protein